MVTLYDNCNSCINRSNCPMKDELKDLHNDIYNRYCMTRALTQDSISIAIKCGKYSSDFGKGVGI